MSEFDIAPAAPEFERHTLPTIPGSVVQPAGWCAPREVVEELTDPIGRALQLSADRRAR